MRFCAQAPVGAVKNIKIDKVTVWDSGNGEKNGTATSNFISNMAKSIPPMNELFDMAGMKLPEYLGKDKVGNYYYIKNVNSGFYLSYDGSNIRQKSFAFATKWALRSVD